MKAYYSDIFGFPLPEDHRFPIRKYARLRERLLSEHVLPDDALLVPAGATDEQLLRVHTEEYLVRLVGGGVDAREMRRIGFPWSPELVERARRSVGGSISACRSALTEGVGVNLAGGTHHAHPSWGSGFCVFNDVAVSARDLLANGMTESIVILDCDVHQGDGTAAAFSQEPRVYTFSIHGAGNFPFRKTAGDLDVALPDGAGDDDYLHALRQALARVFEDASPTFAIYLAGADPYCNDAFGRLSLTKQGLMKRDELVLSTCRQNGLLLAVVMAGGYAPDIDDIVDIHLETVRLSASYSPII